MNRLKEIRKQKGFTQQELGRTVGKYQTFIYNIEREYYVPTIQEKEILAKVLEVDVSELFPDTDEGVSAKSILDRSNYS